MYVYKLSSNIAFDANDEIQFKICFLSLIDLFSLKDFCFTSFPGLLMCNSEMRVQGQHKQSAKNHVEYYLHFSQQI